MLLIILLGVIAKLAVVSADCDIGTTNLSHTNGTNLTGTWYWLYHRSLKNNENLDCPVSTIEAISNNLARITTNVSVKSTQTRDRYIGTVVDWNTNGYYDFYFPVPGRDTNCSPNRSCTKSPEYARIWSGRYQALSIDDKRYVILHHCSGKLMPPITYILFRTPNPDAETLNDVKKDLARNGLDFNQLVKWEHKQC